MRIEKIGSGFTKEYFLSILLFFSFVFKDLIEQSVSFIGYADEMIAFLAIQIFLLELRKNNYLLKIKRGGIW